MMMNVKWSAVLMNKEIIYSQYTEEYISGVMSLRKPQKASLDILFQILDKIEPAKKIKMAEALEVINKQYPTCTDFEREFLSITFALATGVGKTRLMGAFITALYAQYGIKNFFVVAPNITIYEKLKNDLGVPSSPKYVFDGIGCFNINPPRIITEDDYNAKQISMFQSDVNIYIFNISKFDKEKVSMKKINEMLGESFFQYLSNLDDLVLIMDESHHYRAEKGAGALNDLKPILGLELTATPLVTVGNKQVPFKNVVYEYSLSQAIKDGYTRTPYAVTRSDVNFYNFGDEQLDKMMLLDGITCHEMVKTQLEIYASDHEKKIVKPFMMVVCKDTKHADTIKTFIQSDAFRNGSYKNKVTILHSNQKKTEKEENIKKLLSVERSDNPVEIVIHVNKLKEGWDVNNLYTIVPLRTATSKILREQMVGRGLRLPYGERTGDKEVDAVMLTAHDKFDEILVAAQKGDSIFKAGNVIKIEEIVPETVTHTQLALDLEADEIVKQAYEETKIEKSAKAEQLFKQVENEVRQEIQDEIQKSPSHTVTEKKKTDITQKITEDLIKDQDLGEVFEQNENILKPWINALTEKTHRAVVNKYIPIPRIRITDAGVKELYFSDFDIDLAELNHVPIENELQMQNLIDPSDQSRINGLVINFDGYQPQKILLGILREKPEIDYEKCSELLYKLISQVCEHYSKLYGMDGMMNIVMMYKKDIANMIYKQMIKHFAYVYGFIKEEVIEVKEYNSHPAYGSVHNANLYDTFEGNIRSYLFQGVKKGVFSEVKFDSEPELVLARILERDKDVKNWLRPASNEFDITYNHGHRYVPDFVVETLDKIYLVEVKGEDRLNDADVVAKKKRGLQFCETATLWGNANGYKEWQYLFIPSKQVKAGSSFHHLAERFKTL